MPRRAHSAWSSPDLAYAVFVVNALVILGFWWLSSGFEITRNASDFFNGIGRVTGLLGTYLVLWQLLFMARLPWLEHAFGLERMAVLHKWNGYLAIGLLIGHAVFQTLGYQLGDGKDVASQLADFVTSYQGLLAAIVALGLFVAVVVLSITVARRHLAYETWYFIHLYAYLAVALAFSHQLATGVDFAGNPAFVWYWCALYVLVGASLIFYRALGPLASYSRYRFHVQRIEKEARGVFSVYITGRNLDQFPAEAGQFAIWRFMDRKRWWQAHPFSISAIPDGRRLRITVKNIGDFTSNIYAVKPGTPILVDGPFGKFIERPKQPRVLLIAGGIGITPIRPLAEEMADDGFDVRVLYRAHSEGDVVFKKELDELSSRKNSVRVDYLLTQASGSRRSRDSWFSSASLATLVPDIFDRVIYVCGPLGMMAVVRSSLEALGIPSSQIRTEIFRLQ
ncbi:MAG TPA: ferric reductase-like transmembrane domain-containing protein [Candidatus Micrarchaeaceae archaeon]|nr:ferric reductase-like transmembrane domain-containing protein [Candidatus Micrarchaeaceae archaeon]